MKVPVPANFIGYGTFALTTMVGVAYLFKSNGMLADRLPPLLVLDDLDVQGNCDWHCLLYGGDDSEGPMGCRSLGRPLVLRPPKETWALIVWLTYATRLHLRMMKGLRWQSAAWWALIGLLVTTFVFIVVNMFLSGLHSYGEI